MKLAQYRMLGRLVRGERLPVATHKAIGTMAVLVRRGWVHTVGVLRFTWEISDLGRRRHAEQKALNELQLAAKYPEKYGDVLDTIVNPEA